MKILQTLKDDAAVAGWSFLVIGGHAVAHFGWSRETADLDLLVSRELRESFTNWFLKRDYTIYNEKGPFTQLSAPASAWPIDLMWVSQETFSQMFPAAVKAKIAGVDMLVPSLEHLIALKIHSLKNAHIGRYLKDFQDIQGLIETNKLDPFSEKIRALFEKYGTQELYGQICRACSKD